MKIVNNYDLRGVLDIKLKVFWRIFGAWDDAHGVGLKEGLLGLGESVEYNDSEFFQIEFKKENFIGDILVDAGPIYSRHCGDIVLQPNGKSIAQSIPRWSLSKGPYTEWMSNDKVQSKTLLDITIPCTHDSGACRLAPRLFSDSKASDVPGPLADAFAVGKSVIPDVANAVEQLLRTICITQSRPIDQQLNDGIRGFDLRVVTVDHRLYTGHGMVGEPISCIFEKVKQFLEQTKRELVILMLGVGSSTDDSGRKQLAGLIQKTFGDRLVSTDVDLKTTKVADITRQASRVIVTSSGNPDIPGLRPEKDLGYTGGEWWVNTDDPQNLEKENIERVKKHQKPGVFVNPSWTLTAQMSKVADSAEQIGLAILSHPTDVFLVQRELEKLISLLEQVSVRTMSKKVNSRLKPVVEGELAGDRINAIWTDFYEESSVVELAAARSNR